MTTSNLVTTIIPVYNRGGMLREAVDSVLAQTHQPIEIVIVDDGSTDDTPQVAAELAAGQPDVIRVVTQPNGGAGLARNAGLAQARGEFIQYLDSDDLIHPEKFSRQVAAFREHPEAGVCYCITLRGEAAAGGLRPWARTDQHIEHIFPEFLMQRGWATLTPLWRRSVCDQVGPWSDFRVLEDWEHDLRAGLLGVQTVHVAEPLATVRDHAGNRASGMQTGFTPQLTREFFRAHRSIWQQMQAAGRTDWSYLERFARKMFWIARMCGERGLTDEADQALQFAETMVATHQPPREIRLFRLATRLLGWKGAVRCTEGLSRLKGGPRSQAAM